MARSRATETTESPREPSEVREPTSLAVREALWKRRTSEPVAVPAVWASFNALRTWPAISRSPMTAESNPAPTVKRCSMTSVSVLETRAVEMVASERPVLAEIWVITSERAAGTSSNCGTSQ